MKQPSGFLSFGRNIGIKDQSLDFAVVYSQVLCLSTAVFTKNNYPGAPVLVGKEHIQEGKLQAIVVNSKNSNVATGEEGVWVAKETCKILAENLGIQPKHVLPSSTGVIGVPLPKEKIFAACSTAKEYLKENNLEEFAQAILTTDTQKKISYRTYQDGVIFGVAKGAGMIEPNMATMLCYIFSDLLPETKDLYPFLKNAVDISFNCLSIDSDTSTSDTVALLCNGIKGKIPNSIFQELLNEICIDLTKMIARDGEGATKLIELEIQNARDISQARKIGKSIINSPLVKTAIYGGDPNWGRFVMAVGKVFDEKIPYNDLSIQLGNLEVKNANQEVKEKLANYLKSNQEIQIFVNLNQGNVKMKFWGCDLTEGYVKENAFYTT